MNKKTFLFLSGIILLAACAPTSDISGPTATATSIPPTSTMVPTETSTAIATIVPTATNTSTPDIPVSIESYFPQPLTIISSENINRLEVLGILGEGELLAIEINEDNTQITLVYNTFVVTLKPKSLIILNKIKVDLLVDTFQGKTFAISPDGKYFAYSTKYGVNLIDLNSGKILNTLRPYIDGGNHRSNRLSSLEFSDDSQTLFHENNVATGWRLPEGTQIFEEPDLFYNNVSTNFYSTFEKDTIYLKSFENGNTVHSIPVNGDIKSVGSESNISADETMVSVKTNIENIVWDLSTNEKIIEIPNSKYRVSNFSPDGRFIYSSNGKYIQLWDVENDLSNVMIRGGYLTLFSLDGSRLITSYTSNDTESLLIFDTENFNQIANIEYRYYHTYSRLLISPDGKYLVTYNARKKIEIIDLESGKIIGEIQDSIDHFAYDSLLISDSNKLIYKTDSDVKIVDIPSNKLLFNIPKSPIRIFTSNNSIFILDRYGELSKWDVDKGSLLALNTPILPSSYYTLPENKVSLNEWSSIINDESISLFYSLSHKSEKFREELPTLNLSVDAEIYLQYKNGQIFIYDITNMAKFQTVLLRKIDAPNIIENTLRLTPDGITIIANIGDNTIQFWSVETGELIKNIDLNGYITQMIVSPNSDKLYVSTLPGEYRGGLNIYSIPDGYLLLSLEHELKQYTPTGSWRLCSRPPIGLSSNGEYLVMTTDQCALKIIETANWKTIQTIIYGDFPANNARAAISSDGMLLAIAIRHSVVDLWNIPEGIKIRTITIIDEYTNHDEPGIRIGFTPDNKLLAISRGKNGGELLLLGVWP